MNICLAHPIESQPHTRTTDRPFRPCCFTMRQLSKRLTYALRHGSEKIGLNLRPDGFASLDELLSKPSFRGVTRQQVQEVVSADRSAPLVYMPYFVDHADQALLSAPNSFRFRCGDNPIPGMYVGV